MKKTVLLFSLLTLFSITLSAATLRGIVRDGAGHPVNGATVAVNGVKTATDANGAFSLELPDGSYELHVTHPGFEQATREVSASDNVDVTLAPAFAESIVVSAIRAEPETPITKTDMPREEIQHEYHGEDVPLLLRDTPSVTAYTESGVGGSGYSYISLRGVSPTRINFTLDGVPLADSEDFGTYFADFPDLARSLESIQVQRGVGTSTVGSPSFGGSVNFQSVDLGGPAGVDATLGAGSFGTHQVSAAYKSGDLADGMAFYTRVSFLDSDGFRDHSGVKQHNIFFRGASALGAGRLELTGFTGHEKQQMSFYASDADTLKTNLRDNPLRPEERDSFGYDLANLQYIRPMGDNADLSASVYYQRGYGWYRLFDYGTDVLRQYGLDGRLLGTMLTYSKTAGHVTTNYGVHLNRFVRDHTLDEVATNIRDYSNYGVKSEANAFAKVSYDVDRWHMYGDAQVRRTSFDYHGDVSIPSISWTFFNPKVGARYDLTPASSVYASAGMSTREPTRNDMFLGEDNATIVHDLHAVRPERLNDYEAGWNYNTARLTLAADVYAMEFRNEIAATGELSDIGMALRRNVDRSYRRGIELDAAWSVLPTLRLRTNAALSRNRIATWTQFYDVYDDAGEWTGSRGVTYHDVAPLLTPSRIVNQSVDWMPTARFNGGLTGRWVAKSYLDNTNNDSFVTPSYFVLDGQVSFAMTNRARISVHATNLLNNDRVYASGYSYVYYAGDSLAGTSYYYPQATRSAVVLLDITR